MACIGILAAFTGVYTITGGLRAVVWTEMLQLVVLVVGGLTLTVLTVHRTLVDPNIGWKAVHAASRDWHLVQEASDSAFPWTMYIGASLGIGIFYGAANQFMVQRALAVFLDWLTGNIHLFGLKAPHLPIVAVKYLSPFMNRTGIVFWACVVTAVVVSLLTKPEREERLQGLIWNKESLVLPKEQRWQMRGLRNPVIWWGLALVVLLGLYFTSLITNGLGPAVR